MTSRRAVRLTGSVMAILRPRAAIISITNWYAAWPKTTVPLWAPIFGDNKYRVVLKRWQSVGVRNRNRLRHDRGAQADEGGVPDGAAGKSRRGLDGLHAAAAAGAAG